MEQFCNQHQIVDQLWKQMINQADYQLFNSLLEIQLWNHFIETIDQLNRNLLVGYGEN